MQAKTPSDEAAALPPTSLSIEKSGGQAYTVLQGDTPAVYVETYTNPFHGANCYLKLRFLRFDFSMEDLFSLLRREVGRPMQVMALSTDPIAAHLLAGGFLCRRRCHEVTVTQAQLKRPAESRLPLQVCQRGAPTYAMCCELLYHYYSKTHQAISPLTADCPTFSARLPDTAVCYLEDSQVLHCAFIDGSEIAYVGTAREDAAAGFVESLTAYLFRRFDTICFECDDCDPAALALKALFLTTDAASFDTYCYP